MTPIMAAARMGAEGVFSSLVNRGANLSRTTNKGTTLLMFAAMGGNAEITGILLEDKVDINALDNVTVEIASGDKYQSVGGGDTALHYAAEHGSLAVAELLIEYGADIAQPNKGGKSPLISAIEGNSPELVKLLLDKGTNPNRLAANGGNSLYFSVASPNRSIGFPDENKRTMYLDKRVQITKLLISFGANEESMSKNLIAKEGSLAEIALKNQLYSISTLLEK